MIQYHVFPGGKKRIVTFSYDDGHANDKRLIELFNKYGLKSTFHLNGINYINASEERKAELREIYKGHEVACHTLRHGWPARMPQQSVVLEVMEDRRILEDIFGYPIIGMSYPSGSYDADAISAMKACGIVYSRTTVSTRNFAMPKNFMEWHPSCHHIGALDICDKFMDNLDSMWVHPVFYIWGHAHELRNEDDWAMMEKIAEKVGGNDKIWYATNIEIYNYLMAQSLLQISADETVFYNPSGMDVWVEKNKTDIIMIPAGQRITVK